MGKQTALPVFPAVRGQLLHPDALVVMDLVINSTTVPLHLASQALPCAYTISIPVDAIRTNARLYNGFTELIFSVHVRQLTKRCRSLFLALLFPSGTIHYLGPVLSDLAVRSARFVREVSTTLTLLVDIDRCAPVEVGAPLPSEMLLKEHIRTLIENDEFCGSIAAAHVQNLVRDLPFYDTAMQRFHNWSEFITHFATWYHCWKIVEYDAEDHTFLGLSSRTPAGEQRLVANCYVTQYIQGDMHRDRIKRKALRAFRDCVAARGVTLRWSVRKDRASEPILSLSHKLLLKLSRERSFRTLNSVNYMHVLHGLLASHCVLFSELHPVQVDFDRLPDTSPELLLH